MTSNLCLTTICMLQLQVEQALLAGWQIMLRIYSRAQNLRPIWCYILNLPAWHASWRSWLAGLKSRSQTSLGRTVWRAGWAFIRLQQQLQGSYQVQQCLHAGVHPRVWLEHDHVWCKASLLDSCPPSIYTHPNAAPPMTSHECSWWANDSQRSCLWCDESARCIWLEATFALLTCLAVEHPLPKENDSYETSATLEVIPGNCNWAFASTMSRWTKEDLASHREA